MKKRIALALIGLALVVGSVPARAATFTGTLSGTNESPANASPATGAAEVMMDTTAHTLQVDVSFSGLLGNVTAAHIHCCAGPGVNAQIATMVPTFIGFPSGVTSGMYQMTFDSSLASTYNPTFVTAHGGTVAQAEADLFAALMNGMAYFNIHTTMFPGGEIRANLMPPPTPTPTATATATPTVTPQPFGADCTSPTQCESTFCVDGVCCNTACTDPLDRCDLPPRGICGGKAPAPALTPFALVVAAGFLAAVAAVALRRRRGRASL